MATVIGGFMEKVCLAPHSLSIMLEMPGEATYSVEGMYLRRKTWSCHWWVSIWQLWERGLMLPLSAMSSMHSGTQPGPRCSHCTVVEIQTSSAEDSVSHANRRRWSLIWTYYVCGTFIPHSSPAKLLLSRFFAKNSSFMPWIYKGCQYTWTKSSS